MHGLRCYGNITQTRNVSEYTLVLGLCLVAFAAVAVLINHCSMFITIISIANNVLYKTDDSNN